MLHSGERQVAPGLSGIRRDHVQRYFWADTQLPRNSKVLDIGCGVGYGARILADAGHSVVAIDIDMETIAYAKHHYAHPNIEYRAMPEASVSCRNLGAFDAVTCFEVIEHLENPSDLLGRLRHMTARLFASVPNEEVFPYQNYTFHHRHYTRDQFDELLRSTGWAVSGWFGQKDAEASVEPEVNGRTLVVNAIAGEVEVKATAKHGHPEHVVILGLGPSLEAYVDKVKRFGSRQAFADEVWGINAVGDVIQCDRVFHLDDVRVQEARAARAPQSNIANMVKWLRTHPGPIYTSQLVEGYPGLVEYPLEAVINSTGFAYFNGTAAYAAAYAIHLGVKRISFFGADYTYASSHFAERGRGCLEFWIGMAVAKGIEICIPDKSSLLDACEPDNSFYGYDGATVKLAKRDDGSMQVTFVPKELPTAEEIERRYDHSKSPNPLMRPQ